MVNGLAHVSIHLQHQKKKLPGSIYSTEIWRIPDLCIYKLSFASLLFQCWSYGRAKSIICYPGGISRNCMSLGYYATHLEDAYVKIYISLYPVTMRFYWLLPLLHTNLLKLKTTSIFNLVFPFEPFWFIPFCFVVDFISLNGIEEQKRAIIY